MDTPDRNDRDARSTADNTPSLLLLLLLLLLVVIVVILLVEVVLISVTILQKIFIPEADLASIINTLFSLSITDSVLTLRLLLTSF